MSFIKFSYSVKGKVKFVQKSHLKIGICSSTLYLSQFFVVMGAALCR